MLPNAQLTVTYGFDSLRFPTLKPCTSVRGFFLLRLWAERKGEPTKNPALSCGNLHTWVVGNTGLEPVTSRVWASALNQLS